MPGETNYEPTMSGLKSLFDEHQSGGKITFDYQTRVYVGQLSPDA
jgi:hypothetical protein